VAAFSVFFMQSRSFLTHQRLLQTKKGRSNTNTLFQIEQLPSDPQIRNLLDPPRISSPISGWCGTH
jgi:hypothetical protein